MAYREPSQKKQLDEIAAARRQGDRMAKASYRGKPQPKPRQINVDKMTTVSGDVATRAIPGGGVKRYDPR